MRRLFLLPFFFLQLQAETPIITYERLQWIYDNGPSVSRSINDYLMQKQENKADFGFSANILQANELNVRTETGIYHMDLSQGMYAVSFGDFFYMQHGTILQYDERRKWEYRNHMFGISHEVNDVGQFTFAHILHTEPVTVDINGTTYLAHSSKQINATYHNREYIDVNFYGFTLGSLVDQEQDENVQSFFYKDFDLSGGVLSPRIDYFGLARRYEYSLLYTEPNLENSISTSFAIFGSRYEEAEKSQYNGIKKGYFKIFNKQGYTDFFMSLSYLNDIGFDHLVGFQIGGGLSSGKRNYSGGHYMISYTFSHNYADEVEATSLVDTTLASIKVRVFY